MARLSLAAYIHQNQLFFACVCEYLHPLPQQNHCDHDNLIGTADVIKYSIPNKPNSPASLPTQSLDAVKCKNVE